MAARGDGNAPGYLQLANIWMILNAGGGPIPNKPTVTLSIPDPDGYIIEVEQSTDLTYG
jgi:hypothetical protein